jgi:predicted GNAT family acetyltransferase
MEVARLSDAKRALDVVGDSLDAAGAEGELSFGILRRLVAEPDAWGDEVVILVGVSCGSPAALVTMTGAHPALIVGFTDIGSAGFGDLVVAMLGTGRRPEGVNGARRWSEPFVHAWREIAGATADVRREVRAFELHQVRRPRMPAGRFRPATPDDHELLEGWAVAFGEDIAEPMTHADAARQVARLVAADDLAVWDLDGRLVSMAAVVRRTPRSSTIALVYTPPELRGRGFASAAVAELSQRELDAGQHRCSLFTDIANPTSNHIYAAIGYQPKCDFRHYSLAW